METLPKSFRIVETVFVNELGLDRWKYVIASSESIFSICMETNEVYTKYRVLIWEFIDGACYEKYISMQKVMENEQLPMQIIVAMYKCQSCRKIAGARVLEELIPKDEYPPPSKG